MRAEGMWLLEIPNWELKEGAEGGRGMLKKMTDVEGN